MQERQHLVVQVANRKRKKLSKITSPSSPMSGDNRCVMAIDINESAEQLHVDTSMPFISSPLASASLTVNVTLNAIKGDNPDVSSSGAAAAVIEGVFSGAGGANDSEANGGDGGDGENGEVDGGDQVLTSIVSPTVPSTRSTMPAATSAVGLLGTSSTNDHALAALGSAERDTEPTPMDTNAAPFASSVHTPNGLTKYTYSTVSAKVASDHKRNGTPPTSPHENRELLRWPPRRFPLDEEEVASIDAAERARIAALTLPSKSVTVVSSTVSGSEQQGHAPLKLVLRVAPSK